MARRPAPCAVLALGSLSLLACDPSPGAAERDPSAKQVISLREDGTSISRYAADGASIFLQTDRGMSPASKMMVRDTYRVNLTTGERTPQAAGILNFHEDGSVSDPPAFVSTSDSPDGRGGYLITVSYPDGREPVTIDRVDSAACCDWLAAPWAIGRYDEDRKSRHVWIGRFDALRKADDGLGTVNNWRRDALTGDFLLNATADLTKPLTFGIWRVGLDGHPAVPVLGSTLGPFVAVDPSEDPSQITSPSLVPEQVDLQQCWSPGDWSTYLDFNIPGTRCYAVYQRDIGNKQTRLFLRDYAENTERLLPGLAPSNMSTTWWNSRWLAWWGKRTSEPSEHTLFVYDLATRAVTECPTGTPGSVIWQTSGQGAIVVAGSRTTAPGSELIPWDLTSPGCLPAGTATGPNFVLSPNGQRWAWLETDPLAGSKITLADRDLANQRVLAEGVYFQQIGFLDDKRMLIWRTGLDGYGYSWIDATLDKPVEHAIAEQVFFISARLDAHRILVGHRFSDQDKTGDLSLIDMDTGKEQLISHSVSDASLRFLESTDDGKTRTLEVAFLVRGRYASSQDGLWLAKLPFEIEAPQQ